MMNLFLEAVVLSFVLGGMLGAAVAVHLKDAKVRVKDAKVCGEQQMVELVRKRSRL
jgi:hypothetical protein